MRTGNRKWAALAAAGCLLLSAAAMAAPEAGRSELNGDTIEYNMKTGEMTARGHVVLRYEDGMATADYAEYNIQTSTGTLTGGVVADKGDMHIVCDRVDVLSKTQIAAVGNVHGKQGDKQLDSPRVEYRSDEEYVCMPQGGTVATADGSVTADYMEGWMNEKHYRGVGNAHIVSPPKNFEGGGNEAEYFGSEKGKVVLKGDAWAVQDNHTLKSSRLTVYLDDEGRVEAKPKEEGNG